METKDDGQVRHYYDRAKRLAKASDDARFAVERHQPRKIGLLRSLVATRGLAILLFTIVLMVVAIFVVDWVGRDSDQGALAGSHFGLEAFWFEGQVYLAVSRLAIARGTPPRSVELELAVGGESIHAVMAAGENEFKTRVAAPAKPARLTVALSAGDERLQLQARVK